jgi:hypothetical protein
MVFFPPWLHVVAMASVATGLVCALAIALDERRRPQTMGVMNAVWPLCALFGGLLWLAFYWRWGRSDDEVPMAISVAKGTSHCGAGCTLGDLTVEWFAYAVPGLATVFGYGSLFGERTFAIWIPDYLVAFLIGIAFQYFAIAPMRHLGLGEGLGAAVKADAASITSWQVGMYGAMALGQFLWFRPAYGGLAPVASPEFWFLMQLAMLAGFATAYPVNWWLVRAGVKERM